MKYNPRWTSAGFSSAASITNVATPIDDDRLASDVIRAEQIEDGLRHVFRAAKVAERGCCYELVGLFLRPAFREEDGTGRDCVHADLRRKCVCQRSRHLDDSRFGNRVGDVTSPRLERGEVCDVDDRAAEIG